MHPFHLMLTEGVVLKNSSINGEPLAETLPEDSEKIILDVY